MKPGDHPEFFRFPPPPGTSRESTIRIDRGGAVFHDGGLVDRPSLSRALLSWVRRHPDDGRFILSNGYDWTYVGVDDTASLAKRLYWRHGVLVAPGEYFGAPGHLRIGFGADAEAVGLGLQRLEAALQAGPGE